jgi:hypothetical protein
MTTETDTSLELDDIQAAALMPRPNPYAARISRCASTTGTQGGNCWAADPLLEPVSSFDPDRPVSLGWDFSFAGLEAIGVPAESLATFPSEFQQGMAARADYIGDVGESAPENWEAPWVRRTSTSWWPRSRGTPPHGGPGQAGAGRGPQPARRHPGLDAGRARATRRTRAVRLQGLDQ